MLVTLGNRWRHSGLTVSVLALDQTVQVLALARVIALCFWASWMERGTMRVKCLAQELNTVPRLGLEPHCSIWSPAH